jgi:hypothetical protein
LCLALWENAADVELPIPGEYLRESKTQRRERQDAEIKLVLERLLTTDPRKAVSEAYFKVIVPIKQRTKLVLEAALGPTATESAWILDGDTSASGVRSGLAHGKIAGLDAHSISGFPDKSRRLATLTQQLVGRTLSRRWQGSPLEVLPRQFTATTELADCIVCAPDGGWGVTADSRITLDLVARKGFGV